MSHNVNTRNSIDGTHYCCSAAPVHTGCSGSAILSHSGSPRLARNTHSPVEPNRTDTCSPWIPESTDPLDLRVNKSQSCLIKYKYRDADKSLARPGRKKATATEDFDIHISYL